jgi:hypothetical protein
VLHEVLCHKITSDLTHRQPHNTCAKEILKFNYDKLNCSYKDYKYPGNQKD